MRRAIGKEQETLTVHVMLGYEDSLKEMNRRRGAGWRHAVAKGPPSERRVGLDGLVGQESGMQRACWDKLMVKL